MKWEQRFTTESGGRPGMRPVGPSAARRQAQSTEAAPCSTERGAPGPPMSVRTQPGQTAFTRAAGSSRAHSRVRAFSAALLGPYPPGGFSQRARMLSKSASRSLRTSESG
jgi:hypothetical protein